MKRIDFCQKLLEDGDTLDDVVFSDECMIQLKPAHRKSYLKNGQLRKYRAKPKHPVRSGQKRKAPDDDDTDITTKIRRLDGQEHTLRQPGKCILEG